MPRNAFNNRGFSLIEMAIVLLIAGFLIAGAFQLVTSVSQQRTDQATAGEMRTVVLALERFLTEQQGPITAAVLNNPAGGSVRLTNFNININGTPRPALTYFQQNYLPDSNLANGFDLTSAGYIIGIRRLPNIAGPAGGRPVLNAVVLRNLRNPLSESRVARIAGLVGPQGGLVRDNGSGASQVAGLQDSWGVNPAQYGIGGQQRIGQLAAYTTTINTQGNANIISRVGTGNTESNTMRADLIMGSVAGRSQAYAIRNTAAYGQSQTEATVGQACDDVDVDLLNPANGLRFNPRKLVRAEKFMMMTGKDAAGVETFLVQCVDNGSGTFQWKQVGGANFGTSINHRAFFEYRDRDNFPNMTRTGPVCTNDDMPDSPNCVSPTWNDFKSNFNNSNFNAVAATSTVVPRRMTNRWYYNDTGRPMVISILFSDRADWAWLYARDNYDSGTNIASGDLKILSVIKSRDNDGAYSLTAIIPINAAYALGYPNSGGQDTRVEYWSEYNAY